MKIIAILDCSSGSDSVGEMWQETKSFDCNDTILEVVTWAQFRSTLSHERPLKEFRANLKLTIDQSTTEDTNG